MRGKTARCLPTPKRHVNEAADKLIAEPDFDAVMTAQRSDTGLSESHDHRESR
ncbi:hypothetical protein [Actinomadura miaoliensis]|uniref:DUF397 domain-containing protein n=1 Tax=Actinomadura miaoliensis TaxID=430685 RepID=A0ABP7W4U9_9ACTN